MDNYVLSKRDYLKLKRLFAWFDRNQHLRNTVRRRGGIPGSGGSSVSQAFCKSDAATATTVECYLDEDWDGTGDEPEVITVNCHIAGGGDLSIAAPRLKDGTQIDVTKIDNEWWCIDDFFRIEINEAASLAWNEDDEDDQRLMAVYR